MSTQILKPASKISTHFRCDNCGVLLDNVRWMQCKLCKAFDLCDDCASTTYDKLSRDTIANHQKLHKNTPITGDCLKLISVYEAETDGMQDRLKRRQKEYERIVNEKQIENDYEMSVVIDKLKHDSPSTDNQVNSLVVKYYLKANQRNIRVLSLDGGGKRTKIMMNWIVYFLFLGVRGYMPIKILSELITQKYLPNISNLNLNDEQYKKSFREAQLEFTKQFDYFVGTSTGGLIAFCLAINYNILDMKEIYSNSKKYFKKNYLGPLIYSKYDPSVIHNKIDQIIDEIIFPGGKKISSKHATLLDIRNLLNPDRIIDEEKAKSILNKHGNFLEFVDEKNPEDTGDTTDESNLHRVPREKVLLITSYNTKQNMITIFNTSYAKHWGYRIADVLKATMAAPTYFPPHEAYRGTQTNGYFIPEGDSELFVDGGVFANDPELAALWAIRMQWKKPANYHLLSVGTGCYTSTLSSSTWGGYFGWIFNQGILVNTLMDATRSFTEIIGGNLAKFNNIRRMKLNYQITKPMALDDPDFVRVFDREWEYLKNEDDFKAFVYFYNNYIL
jgi:predicted acylesterase/phospholipase RssA